jgi:hypothetical protein
MLSFIFPVLLAVMPLCPTEDSSWCVWDEDQSGNLTGTSFVALWGDVYFTVDR